MKEQCENCKHIVNEFEMEFNPETSYCRIDGLQFSEEDGYNPYCPKFEPYDDHEEDMESRFWKMLAHECDLEDRILKCRMKGSSKAIRLTPETKNLVAATIEFELAADVSIEHHSIHFKVRSDDYWMHDGDWIVIHSHGDYPPADLFEILTDYEFGRFFDVVGSEEESE